ncbi:MAG: ComF family protein [bacterium]
MVTKSRYRWNIVYRGLRPFWQSLLDFLYPPNCLICDTYLDSQPGKICADCWFNLPRLPTPVRNIAVHRGVETELSSVQVECLSVWEFADGVQTLIHELKYFGKKSIAISIADEMAAVVRAQPDFSAVELILPVPLHKVRQRERGYNQSHLLSVRLAEILQIPVAENLLLRVRYTQSQSKLSLEARQKNVRDAFKVLRPERIEGKTCLLVDDVLTTGATLSACAGCLLQAGAVKVLATTAAQAIKT